MTSAWHDALAVSLGKHKAVPSLPHGRTKPTMQGIPVIMDQSMNLLFGGIFDLGFTESGYVFRRGKSQHMAILHVQDKVWEGKNGVNP